jgi:deoxyadenosine/deoxycytidine kinase
MVQIIAIEGNIGSGKSTFLEKLTQYYKNNNNILFLTEPVNEWEQIKDENNNTILEKFYGNQEKYSFSFQIMAYISRLALLKNAVEQSTNSNLVIITERSLYTDKYVFAKMLYDTNKIEKINYEIYLKWFDTFANDYPIEKVIYINASPEICFDRIIKRSRNGESNISLDYLIMCDKYHTIMINKYDKKNVNVINLNGNNDIYKHTYILNNWIQLVNITIEKMQSH